jgi:hypothetical protein
MCKAGPGGPAFFYDREVHAWLIIQEVVFNGILISEVHCRFLFQFGWI